MDSAASSFSAARQLRARLLVCVLPAVLGSMLLLRAAGAGSALMLQQLAVFCVGGLLILAPRGVVPATEGRKRDWLGWWLAALLFLPLLGGGDGPSRWLGAGGFRLYLAPVVLPALLLLARGWGSWLAAALALVAQPDAAQATALAAGGGVLLCARPGPPSQRLGVAALLGALAACAWLRPDPLRPVDFVEGVFRLAGGFGFAALGAAVLAGALPALAFAGQARRHRSPALLAWAVSALTLLALAPLEVTPVPLLGFGAGPILGHLLAVLLAPAAARNSRSGSDA